MRIGLGLLASLALLTAGCNDNKLSGEAPRIQINPSSIDFDPTMPGSPSTKIATVTNVGGGVLVVNDIQIGGQTPAAFHANAANNAGSGLPIELAPGEWFAVQVTFAPTDTGTHSGILSAMSNDASQPSADVPLNTATLAPRLEASPNPLNMVATVNQTVTGEITVANTGSADLTVSGASLGASTSAFFTLAAATFPHTLAPGESFPLTVSFHPTSSAAAAGSVDIASDDPLAPTTSVALNGNGSIPNAPQIVAVPNPINFGDVQRLTCATQTTSVKNVGNSTLNVTNITRQIFTSTDFTWTPNSFSVAPGAAQTLSVTFCPTHTGLALGSLQVASNDTAHNPYSIGLKGNGTPPPLTATDISVKLTWNTNDTDVDTHLWRGNGSFNNNTGDCYYANCVGVNPDWGVVGDASDNPYLDTDDVDGNGPENLNVSNAATDTYTVAIYYYSDHGHGGATNATVTVYVNGTAVYTATKSITNFQLWTVGRVAWNHTTDSGTWSLVDTVAATAAPGPILVKPPRLVTPDVTTEVPSSFGAL